MNYTNYSEQSVSEGIFEINYNLLYLPINLEVSDSESYPEGDPYSNAEDESSEESLVEETVDGEVQTSSYSYSQICNILIYDIPKNQKNLLFAEGELDEATVINSLNFEQAHCPQTARMLLASSSYNVRNNFNLQPREARNKLFLELYNQRTQEYQLWICDKWGNDKQRIARWSDTNNFSWHLDLMNDVLRILVSQKGHWQITELPW